MTQRRRATATLGVLAVVGTLACGDSSGPGAAPGSWQARASMQTPRVDFGTAVFNGRIYAIGGFSGSVLGSVEAYDPTTDLWQARASMPTPRRDLVVAALGSRIYAVGGASYTSANVTTHLAATEEYDPASNTWTSRADVPLNIVGQTTERVQYVGGAAASGLVFVFVYENDICAATRTLAFDPATNTWTATRAPPPFPGRYAAATLNDRIYLLVTSWPACYSGPDPINTLAEYNPASDSWIILPALATGRSLAALAAANGRLYAIGGIVEPDTLGRSTAVTTVHEFDPVARTWRTIAGMPTARSSLGAAAIGARIFAMGGSDRNVPLSVVEELTVP